MIAKRAAGSRVRLAVAAGMALLATACAAGKQAQTVQETPVNDAQDATAGFMEIRGAAILAPSGNSYAKGSSAQMQVVFVNDGTKSDTLVSITSPAFTGWSTTSKSSASATPLALSSSSSASATSSSSTTSSSSSSASPGSQRIMIAPNSRVSFGVPDATQVLQVTGIKRVLYPASPVRVTFNFQRAGSVTTVLPVQLTSTPGTEVVGGESSSPAGAGAAAEPASSEATSPAPSASSTS